MFGRWGGEEFVGIFSINRNYEASIIAERLRHLVENTVVTNSDGQELKVTISVGVTIPRYVETVCLLSELHEAKHHVNVRLDMGEMNLTAAESKATYEEIKKYVAKHNDGMKVSNLYIAQVKRKCGIEVGENFNLPKSEDSRQLQCPKEKEDAIVKALKAFRMI